MPRPKTARPAKRHLVRWTDEMDKKLLLTIQSVCNSESVKIPWEKVANVMGSGISDGAVIQHLAKLRQRMITQNLSVPPPLRRGSGSAFLTTATGGLALNPKSNRKAKATAAVVTSTDKGNSEEEGSNDDNGSTYGEHSSKAKKKVSKREKDVKDRLSKFKTEEADKEDKMALLNPGSKRKRNSVAPITGCKKRNLRGTGTGNKQAVSPISGDSSDEADQCSNDNEHYKSESDSQVELDDRRVAAGASFLKLASTDEEWEARAKGLETEDDEATTDRYEEDTKESCAADGRQEVSSMVVVLSVGYSNRAKSLLKSGSEEAGPKENYELSTIRQSLDTRTKLDPYRSEYEPSHNGLYVENLPDDFERSSNERNEPISPFECTRFREQFAFDEKGTALHINTNLIQHNLHRGVGYAYHPSYHYPSMGMESPTGTNLSSHIRNSSLMSADSGRMTSSCPSTPTSGFPSSALAINRSYQAPFDQGQEIELGNGFLPHYLPNLNMAVQKRPVPFENSLSQPPSPEFTHIGMLHGGGGETIKPRLCRDFEPVEDQLQLRSQRNLSIVFPSDDAFSANMSPQGVVSGVAGESSSLSTNLDSRTFQSIKSPMSISQNQISGLEISPINDSAVSYEDIINKDISVEEFDQYFVAGHITRTLSEDNPYENSEFIGF